MVFVPLATGVALGGPTWLQAWLALAWLLAFLFFNVFGLYVKARWNQRYRAATLTYGASAGALALGLAAVRPDLLIWGPALAVMFAVALWQIWVRRERSLIARLSAIGASSLMSPIAFSLGSHPEDWPRLGLATAIVALYFAGTVPYVKTLIRQRGDRSWLLGSLTYHGALVLLAGAGLAAGWVSWLVPAVALILFARAGAYPWISARRRKPLPPAVVGITEFGYCALVLAAAVWGT